MNFLKYFFLFSASIVIPGFASEQAVEAVSDTTTLNFHAAAPHRATNPHLAEALQLTEQFIAFELDNYDKERARTQKIFSNPHIFLKNVRECQTIQQKLMYLDRGETTLGIY